MINFQSVIKTAPYIWIDLDKSGFLITNYDYTCRAIVDICVLEILSLCQYPNTPESVVEQLSGKYSISTIKRRLKELIEDKFLYETENLNTHENHEWWERWGTEALRFRNSTSKVEFLPNDIRATNYKKHLGKIPDVLYVLSSREDNKSNHRPPALGHETPIDYWQLSMVGVQPIFILAAKMNFHLFTILSSLLFSYGIYYLPWD